MLIDFCCKLQCYYYALLASHSSTAIALLSKAKYKRTYVLYALFNIDLKVQVSDTTGDAKRTKAGTKKYSKLLP